MSEPTIIICMAHYDEQRVEVEDCPTCKGPQQMFCQHEDWYGWTVTCLTCGERWMDSEMCPRPFAPGWRKKQAQEARDKAVKLGLLQMEAR